MKEKRKKPSLRYITKKEYIGEMSRGNSKEEIKRGGLLAGQKVYNQSMTKKTKPQGDTFTIKSDGQGITDIIFEGDRDAEECYNSTLVWDGALVINKAGHLRCKEL